MNKYIIKALLCSALAVPVLTSCELDQYPTTSLPTEQSWQTISDASNHQNGLLALLRGQASGYGAAQEAQADLFNQSSISVSYVMLHNWTFTTAQFDGDGLYSGNYNLIANANDILNNIDRIQFTTEGDSAYYGAYTKGLAYFGRAWAYSTMAMRYCKNYTAETASTTLGLPLVTAVDVAYKPSRSSLADTYALILSDIEKAKAWMNDSTDTEFTQPHYNTVLALEARVALNMQDYAKALSVSENLMKRYSLCTTNDELTALWAEDASDEGGEIIYQPLYTTGERSRLYGIFISHDATKEFYTPDYLPTQGLMDLYKRGDRRKNLFFKRDNIMSGSYQTTGYFLNKFPGNQSLLTSNDNATTAFYNMPKPFRTAEIYLIAAEAAYKLGNTEKALEYVNALRTSRGASKLTSTGDQLFSDIKDEWTREFVGEGFRLNNLKRWGDGFTRMAAQSLPAGFLRTENGVIGQTISADNYRFVWELPSQDLQANKNLERNWPTDN